MKIKQKILALLILLSSTFGYAQSDTDKLLKGGELLLNGLNIFKSSKNENKMNSDIIETICVKNQLGGKITFKITSRNEKGDDIKKELVIPKGGKECLYKLPKGIYAYEILLSNTEVYKKGEYIFEENLIITVKED